MSDVVSSQKQFDVVIIGVHEDAGDEIYKLKGFLERQTLEFPENCQRQMKVGLWFVDDALAGSIFGAQYELEPGDTIFLRFTNVVIVYMSKKSSPKLTHAKYTMLTQVIDKCRHTHDIRVVPAFPTRKQDCGWTEPSFNVLIGFELPKLYNQPAQTRNLCKMVAEKSVFIDPASPAASSPEARRPSCNPQEVPLRMGTNAQAPPPPAGRVTYQGEPITYPQRLQSLSSQSLDTDCGPPSAGTTNQNVFFQDLRRSANQVMQRPTMQWLTTQLMRWLQSKR